jgi:hypothetical protein
VFHEASINVHHNCQGNCSFSSPAACETCSDPVFTWYVRSMYWYVLIMGQYVPQLANLKWHSSICLTAKHPLAKLVKVHFEMEVLIAFEDNIFHNLPTNIFHLTNPEVQILISDVSNMPWVCLQFCEAAVSQKLLPYNIIEFKNILKLKLYNIIKYFKIFYNIK